MCWLPTPVIDEHVQLLNGTKDLLLKQQTPIRYALNPKAIRYAMLSSQTVSASCAPMQAAMLCASSLVTPPCSMHPCRSSCTDLPAGCLQSVSAAGRPGQGAAGAQHELPAGAWQPSLPHPAAANPGMCMTVGWPVKEVLPCLEHTCFWEADGAIPARCCVPFKGSYLLLIPMLCCACRLAHTSR